VRMNDAVSRDEAEFGAEVAQLVTDLGHDVFQIDTRMARCGPRKGNGAYKSSSRP